MKVLGVPMGSSDSVEEFIPLLVDAAVDSKLKKAAHPLNFLPPLLLCVKTVQVQQSNRVAI